MLGAIVGGITSLIGGRRAEKNATKQSNVEYQRQKEFAQSGISWKVKDAKRAGIAPLAALGAPLTSYAPQSISGGDGGISQFGQDIGRAIDATRSPGQRADAYTRTAQALELERGGLQNELLRAQIAKLNQPGNGPGIAVDSENYTIPGQPNSGIPGVVVQPSKSVTVTPNTPHEQRGTVPDVMWVQTNTGGYAPVPSSHAKELIEDQMIPEIGWAMRNVVTPMISTDHRPPAHVPLKPRHKWIWDSGRMEYRQQRRNRYKDLSYYDKLPWAF